MTEEQLRIIIEKHQFQSTPSHGGRPSFGSRNAARLGNVTGKETCCQSRLSIPNRKVPNATLDLL